MNNTIGASSCSYCPNGMYSNISVPTSLNDCVTCNIGYYCIYSAQTACPLNTFCNQTGLSAPQMCTNGYCCVNSTSIEPCVFVNISISVVQTSITTRITAGYYLPYTVNVFALNQGIFQQKKFLYITKWNLWIF